MTNAEWEMEHQPPGSRPEPSPYFYWLCEKETDWSLYPAHIRCDGPRVPNPLCRGSEPFWLVLNQYLRKSQWGEA